MSGRADPNDKTRFILNGRYIPEKNEDGRLYFSVKYRVLDDLTVGVDYRPLSQDIGILANWRVVPEKKLRPAVILGTSTDDFGDITSQSVSAVMSKNIYQKEKFSVSPYAGAVYVFELEELRPVGGVSIRYDRWSVMGMYSGTDAHLVLSHRLPELRATVSAVYWGMKYPGVAFSWRF